MQGRIAKEGRAMKSALVVTIIIALSKLTGFVREMIMAAVFGLSVASDAYGSAYSILSLLTMLFTAGLSSTFIPMYVRSKLREGQLAADRYASNVLTLYLIAGVLASILMYFLAPVICTIVFRAPQGLELTIELTRMMYPTLAFYAMTGVLFNVLNARERFIPEQLMGFVLSGCLIAAILMFRDIKIAAIAVAVVGVVQFLLLLPFLRGQFRYYPSLHLSDPRLKRTFLLAVPALISLSLGTLNHQVDLAVGSGLGTGIITTLNKSYALVATVLGILVVPVSTIAFSRLSKIAADRNKKLFMENVRSSLETIILVTLPVTVLAIFLSKDIIAVAYQRGVFDAAATARTAPVFAYYIAGVMPFGVSNLMNRVFYARQDTKTPMLISITSVSINVGLDFVLAPYFGAVGIVVATTVASTYACIVQLIMLRKKVGSIGLKSTVTQTLRILLAIAVALVVTMVLSTMFTDVHGTWQRLLKLASLAIVFFSLYVPTCLLLGVRELKTWMGRLLHKQTKHIRQ